MVRAGFPKTLIKRMIPGLSGAETKFQNHMMWKRKEAITVDLNFIYFDLKDAPAQI